MIPANELVDKFKYALDNRYGYCFGTAGIMWTQARQDQKIKYMESSYGENWKKNVDAKNDNYYYTALYGAKWIGHYVLDCSGFFVWAYKQYGLSMSHISSNIFKSYCTSNKGKLTDDLKKKILPGTAVFTGQVAGSHPHVGLYAGNGKVIEAAGTQAGVCVSNITDRKWTFYGYLKDVSYSSENAPISASEPSDEDFLIFDYPALKKGNKGEYVKLLQTKLLEHGYSLPRYGADGDFGNETLSALKAFQKDHGLTADGIAGKKTWAALNEEKPKEPEKPETYTVIVKNCSKEIAEQIISHFGGEMNKE